MEPCKEMDAMDTDVVVDAVGMPLRLMEKMRERDKSSMMHGRNI